MNIEDFLRKPATSPNWQGIWARLWLRPDVFSAQEFLIGAVALDERGVIDFRVISGAEKFECIYGKGTRAMYERLLSEARKILAKQRADKQPLNDSIFPDIFRVEVVGGLRSQLPSQALERMLEDGTIPMEEDAVKGKRTRFASRQADEVVQEVLDKVREKAGFFAESFICDDYYGDQRHQVGVNLVTQKATGVITSGWYASAERIQLEFLLASTKLDTYVAAKNRDRSKSALFFVRPTVEDGLSRVVATEVEARIEDLEWQLSQQKVRVVTLSNSSEMALEVIDWINSVQ